MQFKRILSLLSAMAMALTAFTGTMTASVVSADDEKYPTSGTCGDSATWLINSDDVLVISGSGKMSDGNPFAGLETAISEVIIEDGITAAGNSVFQTTGSGKSFMFSKITFPPSFTSLNGCLTNSASSYPVLADIYIYSNNITDLSSMYSAKNDGTVNEWHGSGLIWHVYKGSEVDKTLTSVFKLTDEDIEYLDDNAKMPEVVNKKAVELAPVTATSGPAGYGIKYEWDNASKTLTFSGKGIISIPENYYEKYIDKAENVIIESGITGIDATPAVSSGSTGEYGAFAHYSSLKHVELPDGITYVGDGTFNHTPIEDEIDCTTMKCVGQYSFQGTNISALKNIQERMVFKGSAFSGCTKLKELVIPKHCLFAQTSANPIGSASTFSGCKGLETVTILGGGYGAEGYGNMIFGRLGSNMFGGCTSLKTVIFKGDVTNLAGGTFYNCPSLTDLYFYNKELTSIAATTTSNGGDNTAKAIDISNNPTFHVVTNSTTARTLSQAGYLNDSNTVHMLDTEAYDEAVAKAEAAIASRLYTDETVAVLEKALSKANDTLNNPDATQKELDLAVRAINNAIAALVLRPDGPKPEEPSEPSSSEPSSDNSDPSGEPSSDSSKPKTDPTTSPTKVPSTKATRSPAQVTKDKNNAQKTMNQAKITSLKAKAKGKKKIVVSWKKVTKAVGYEVQVAKNNKFNKAIVDTFTNNVKLTIKNPKIKSKKTYFVRVRAYSTYKDANNKPQKVYSKWIKKTRKVKVK